VHRVETVVRAAVEPTLDQAPVVQVILLPLVQHKDFLVVQEEDLLRPIIWVVEVEPQKQEKQEIQALVEEVEQVQQLQFQNHQQLIVVEVAPVVVPLPQR
jgi:hypothetical protein